MDSLGCPRYWPLDRMNWAPVLSLCQEPDHFIGSTYKSSFNLASWAWGVSLRAYFLNPINDNIHIDTLRVIYPNNMYLKISNLDICSLLK